MSYENEILLILHEADPVKGLPLSSIVRNVYNITACDLFNPRQYDDVYADVQKYLRNESSIRGAYVEKADKRGYYRLNKNSQKTQQLLLEFESKDDEDWMN